MSVYWSVECAMHASFSIACAIEWCHFSPVISFVFTILIFAMAFNQRNKINFNIISRWKWDRRFCCCCFAEHLHRFVQQRKKFIFLPIDGNGWRHCNYYVSDYYIRNTQWSTCEMWMKRLHISLCMLCLPLFVTWIFMRWAHFTLSASFSHLFNRHSRAHIYLLLYFQSAIDCRVIQCNEVQVHAKWVPIMSPYIVIVLDFLHRITFINCEHEVIQWERGGKT